MPQGCRISPLGDGWTREVQGGMSSEPYAEGYRTITTFRAPFFASSLSNLFAFRLLSKLAVPKSIPIPPNPTAIGQEGPNSGTRPYIQGWELLFCPRGAHSNTHPPSTNWRIKADTTINMTTLLKYTYEYKFMIMWIKFTVCKQIY